MLLLVAGGMLALAAAALALWRAFERVEVVGASMEPALAPGDRLLVIRGAPLRPGDVIALADPRRPERIIVKRIAGRHGPHLTVLGDNLDASTDSRHFGPIDHRAVHGRVVYRYAPDSRRGRVASVPPASC